LKFGFDLSSSAEFRIRKKIGNSKIGGTLAQKQ
jgi:hypothetical protein